MGKLNYTTKQLNDAVAKIEDSTKPLHKKKEEDLLARKDIAVAAEGILDTHVYELDPTGGTIWSYLDKTAAMYDDPMMWDFIPPEFEAPVNDCDCFDPRLVFRIATYRAGGQREFPVTGISEREDGSVILVLRPFYDQDFNLICGQVLIQGRDMLHFSWWYKEMTLTKDEYKSLEVRDPRTTYYVVES